MGQLYKFLTEDGRGTHSGFAWPLPTDTEPGAWVRVKGELVPCENGLHLCRAQDLRHWFAATLYEAEYRGARLNDDNKIVVAEARLLRLVATWNWRTMVLFACDCAERVLPLFESQFPDDARPREAIAVARDAGRAAGNAAWDARDAGRAAGNAAWDARDAWEAGDAAWAAWDAAWDAWDAWDAAWAAWDAAWDAWDAWEAGDAGDAAGNAAWAARNAAWAAGDAAGAVEIDWQNARLLAYITGEIG